MTPTDGPDRPRAGPVPGPVGRLAARVYGSIIARRNRAFDRGRGVLRLPMPVISVGNLSVGGTGKTPMVMHLCRVLLERRIRPCIAMRGYSKEKRRSGGTGSDEADQYCREFGDNVDVVAQPDRAAGVHSLLGSTLTPPGAVILDDGFQHRRIRRDLDIVLIDASRDPFSDRLLPAGWLREPPSSLRRASCVVVTHSELAEPGSLAVLAQKIEAAHGHRPVATTRHLWTALQIEGGSPAGPAPLDWLVGKRVVGVCAIGNPRGFSDALRLTVSPSARPEFIVLPDHDPFDPPTIARVRAAAERAAADAIVLTDKDWSKVRHLPASSWPCPVVRPVLSLGFVAGQAELERLVLSAVRLPAGQ